LDFQRRRFGRSLCDQDSDVAELQGSETAADEGVV